MTRDTDVAPRLAALHLVALWSIAVAQPIFDVVGRNPEFFVAHAAPALQISCPSSSCCA